jgi:5'-nucleotidase
MRVLISNDDGIAAPGIVALADELRKIAEVIVVAPDKQQSAVGHAITMNSPLRVHPFLRNGEMFGYAVDGTPADAVKMGVRFLLREKRPDLVISGINHGSNTAVSILYSGTVSAATEGTILGIPSFAISVTTHGEVDFGPAARFAAKLAPEVLLKGLPRGTLLNVNVPAIPEKEIRGVRVTKQSQSIWDDTYEVRRDPADREYFWLTGKMDVTDSDPETDQIAIHEGYISISPIHYRLTNEEMFGRMKSWGWEGLK